MTQPNPPSSTAAKSASTVWWKLLVPVAIGVVLWLLPPPSGLSPKAWHMFAIFVATIAGIITAPMPMPMPMLAVAIIGATAAATLTGVIGFEDVVKSMDTDLVWWLFSRTITARAMA